LEGFRNLSVLTSCLSLHFWSGYHSSVDCNIPDTPLPTVFLCCCLYALFSFTVRLQHMTSALSCSSTGKNCTWLVAQEICNLHWLEMDGWSHCGQTIPRSLVASSYRPASWDRGLIGTEYGVMLPYHKYIVAK